MLLNHGVGLLSCAEALVAAMMAAINNSLFISFFSILFLLSQMTDWGLSIDVSLFAQIAVFESEEV